MHMRITAGIAESRSCDWVEGLGLRQSQHKALWEQKCIQLAGKDAFVESDCYLKGVNLSCQVTKVIEIL